MENEETFLKGKPAIRRETQQEPTIKERIVYSSDAIAKKREELELKRLEIELSKLDKPDTSVDYYSKMLELQRNSFEQQIKMLSEHQGLKLEIEKLKMAQEQGGGDFAEDFLYNLMPLIPEILKANKVKEELKGGEKPPQQMDLMDKKQQEEYKLKIKAGVISLEDAYKDFCENFPQLKDKITREQFEKEFNKIKNS